MLKKDNYSGRFFTLRLFKRNAEIDIAGERRGCGIIGRGKDGDDGGGGREEK